MLPYEFIEEAFSEMTEEEATAVTKTIVWPHLLFWGICIGGMIAGLILM
jgi:hypothetical protein